MKRFLFLLLFVFSFASPTFSASPAFSVLSTVQPVGQVVYVTKTGTKYHISSCHHLRQSKIKTTKSQAVKNGYSACKVCKP